MRGFLSTGLTGALLLASSLPGVASAQEAGVEFEGIERRSTNEAVGGIALDFLVGWRPTRRFGVKGGLLAAWSADLAVAQPVVLATFWIGGG